jgi:Mg-chelatase subunit ChlD
MRDPRRRRRRGIAWLIPVLIASVWVRHHSGRRSEDTAPESRRAPAPVNPIDALLASTASAAPRQEGIAAAILLDVSGSMADKVPAPDGQPARKIDIARRTVSSALQRFEAFAKEHPDRNVRVGVYEFSTRAGQPSCRVVVPLGPPNRVAADAALAAIKPKGGTPIGDAMLRAKSDLDSSGFSRRHILVVTDGENNHGYSPGDVTAALARQRETVRASLYFIAFDIEAERFNMVRGSGGLVLAAANEAELGQTFDYLVSGKILAEQPLQPQR